jgi:hypothetical protein
MISPEGLVFFHQFLQEWMEFHVMHGNMAESPWKCPVLVENMWEKWRLTIWLFNIAVV